MPRFADDGTPAATPRVVEARPVAHGTIGVLRFLEIYAETIGRHASKSRRPGIAAAPAGSGR